MTTSVVVRILMPPACISGNARGVTRAAKMAEADARRRQRESAYTQTLAMLRHQDRKWKHAAYVVTATFADARIRDRDNILRSVKSAIDGFADAAMIDGSDADVQPIYVERQIFRGCVPSVAIEFRRGFVVFDAEQWQAYFVPE